MITEDISRFIFKVLVPLFVGLAIVCCYVMSIGKIEDKLAIIIDGLELKNATSVTVGENSSINFHQIPHDYLTITKEGDSFRWEVNDRYHDSLQYFKINNENPNKHVIRNDRQQCITIKLSSRKGDINEVSMSGADVWRTWDSFIKQKDVLARNFAAKYQFENNKTSREDSLRIFDQMQDRTVNSFFDKDGNNIVLIILDERSTIYDGQDTIRYVRSGRTSNIGDLARHCKVQFFGINDYSFKEEDPQKDRFQINGVNYAMKPYVKLTEWGAGHAMIESSDTRNEGSGLNVYFPKPITFVGTVDTLKEYSKLSSGIITLRQNNNSIPSKGDLYIPEFSSAINFDVCNIELHHHDSVMIRDNNFELLQVENHFSVVPSFSKMKLHTGDDVLIGRAGFIDTQFILSYLWLPLLVFVITLLFIWVKWSPLKLSEADLSSLYCPDRIRQYRYYLTLLLTICLAYCICKSLIVLKLSYTYPYFEKMTGIIPISTSIMMLMFVFLTMIINTPLLHLGNASKSFIGRWWGCVMFVLLYASLVFATFCILDLQVNEGVINSYIDSEISFFPILLNWQNSAILDTHRSVIYSLIAVNGLLLLLWVILNFNFSWKWIQPLLTRCYSKVQNINWGWRAVGHAFLLGLIILCSLAGNFGTALITLLVIVGLSNALSYPAKQITKSGRRLPRWGYLLIMLAITLSYIGAAIVLGDRGYLTNYLGFLAFLVCMFYIVERPVTYNDFYAQKYNKWDGIINNCLLVLIVAVALFLPYFLGMFTNPEKVDYSRQSRRFALYSDFSRLQEGGYRYQEGDAEFMVIMSHYMQQKESEDPLSNDFHFMHSSISSGQSPVVLNDLSLPIAFVGVYGVTYPIAVFFLLLLALTLLVMSYNYGYTGILPLFNVAMQWRLLAMMMWIGTSIYIFLSYIGMLPFTGRLNPGFGVDAVGEALETAILLAFMASITCKEINSYSRNN